MGPAWHGVRMSDRTSSSDSKQWPRHHDMWEMMQYSYRRMVEEAHGSATRNWVWPPMSWSAASSFTLNG